MSSTGTGSYKAGNQNFNFRLKEGSLGCGRKKRRKGKVTLGGAARGNLNGHFKK